MIGAATKAEDQTFNIIAWAEVFTMCKAREILPRRERKGKGKEKGKGKDQQEMKVDSADRILLQLSLNPLCPLALSIVTGIMVPTSLHSILLEATHTAQGEVCTSGPPPLKAERQVFADHGRLAKQVS